MASRPSPNRYPLVSIDRKPIDPDPLRGFFLEQSERLILINVLNEDVVDLNGYCVIRKSDVRQLKIPREDSFVVRALKLKRVTPQIRHGISLGSWPDLLHSASSIFPLITIHREIYDRDVCLIGRPILMGNHSFQLKEIDTKARWSRSRRYKFSDLTKVDFGGGYEDALVRVSADDEAKE
jgi:hypothetical protein